MFSRRHLHDLMPSSESLQRLLLHSCHVLVVQQQQLLSFVLLQSIQHICSCSSTATAAATAAVATAANRSVARPFLHRLQHLQGGINGLLGGKWINRDNGITVDKGINDGRLMDYRG